MKLKNKKYAIVKLKIIILILLIIYIIWLVRIFYNTFIEIDKMYLDSYNKRVDFEDNINEIRKVKNDNLDYKDNSLYNSLNRVVNGN